MNLFEIQISFFIQIHEYSMPHTREKISMLCIECILSTTKIMLEFNTSCGYIWNWDVWGRWLKQGTETAQIDQCHLMSVGSCSHRTRLTTEYVIKNWLWLCLISWFLFTLQKQMSLEDQRKDFVLVQIGEPVSFTGLITWILETER